jgi:hypothetical protein
VAPGRGRRERLPAPGTRQLVPAARGMCGSPTCAPIRAPTGSRSILLTKATGRLRRGDYHCRRLGLHLSWFADLGGYWDEITFRETARHRLSARPPRAALSTDAALQAPERGVVLLDLVPAARYQPDLFAPDNHRRQKLSPLIGRINDRYGRYNLRPVAPVIATVSMLRQFAAASFEIEPAPAKAGVEVTS